MENDKVNIISIPPDKSITIEIGGLFYQRLNKLAIEYGDTVSQEELIRIMRLIKLNKAKSNNKAFNLETLLILMRDIEKAFMDAGNAVETEINIPEVLKDIDLDKEKD